MSGESRSEHQIAHDFDRTVNGLAWEAAHSDHKWTRDVAQSAIDWLVRLEKRTRLIGYEVRGRYPGDKIAYTGSTYGPNERAMAFDCARDHIEGGFTRIRVVARYRKRRGA